MDNPVIKRKYPHIIRVYLTPKLHRVLAYHSASWRIAKSAIAAGCIDMLLARHPNGLTLYRVLESARPYDKRRKPTKR